MREPLASMPVRKIARPFAMAAALVEWAVLAGTVGADVAEAATVALEFDVESAVCDEHALVATAKSRTAKIPK